VVQLRDSLGPLRENIEDLFHERHKRCGVRQVAGALKKIRIRITDVARRANIRRILEMTTTKVMKPSPVDAP
jgi:hypothetical protein